MVLNFKKRRFFANHDDTSDYQYTIFGYYDVMSIRPCYNWFQFSPSALEIAENYEYGSEYYDEYPIKLLFPTTSEQEELEKNGFRFSSWWQIATLNNSTYSYAPLLSVILINVSPSFFSEVSSNDTALTNMAQKVLQASGGTTVLQDLCCAPFQSIGYYDFAVLLRTKDWGDALRLANALRENSSISNCYLIPGIYNQCGTMLSMLPSQHTTELSVRFNLRPGISPTSFRDRLLSEIQKNYSTFDGFIDHELSIRDKYWEDFGPQFSMNYGRSDCLMTCGLPLRFLLPVFLNLGEDVGFLNPGSYFFRQNISSMRTSIRQSIDPNRNHAHSEDTSERLSGEVGKVSSTIQAETEGTSQELQDLKKKFQKVLETLHKYLVSNQLSIRQSRVLENAMANFENLARNLHSFDISAIITPAFHTLLRNINQTITQIDTEKDPVTHIACMDRMNDMISAFRDLVGSFLLDLSASDRFFIEGLKLTHASIGSATKLLFAYNHIANLTVRALADEETDKYKNYSFVVISGGCDVTLTHSIDNHLQPTPRPDDSNSIQENRLLIVQLSEAGIFDIRGTLFRLLHEIMHFCGDRLRKKRAAAIVQHLSLTVAETLRFVFFPPSYLAKICRINSSHKSELNAIIQRYDQEFSKEIAEYLEAELLQNLQLQKCNPIDLYSEQLQNCLYKLCANLLQPSQAGTSAFVRRVYCAQLRAMANIYRDCAEKNLSPDTTCSIAMVGAADAMCYLQDAESDINQPLTSILYSHVTLALVNYALAGMLGLDCTYCSLPGWTGEQTAKLSAYFQDNCLSEILGDIISLYSEGFADCMACTLLDLSISDYLLSFLYEINDPVRAMPDTYLHTMRLGAVLEVCFRETSKNLSHDSTESLQNTFFHWKKCGWAASHLSVEKIIQRTNQLLDAYDSNSSSGEKQPLVKYLQECISSMSQSDSQSLKSIYNLFKTAHKLETHDDVVNCVHTLLQLWQQYAVKEEFNETTDN